MDLEPGTATHHFPAGGFVRLRSRSGVATYLHADEDALGVSLRPLGATPPINTVWWVQHFYEEGDEAPYVLLQTAAYGRYLAATNGQLPDGFSVVQSEYNTEELHPWFVWRAYTAGDDQYIRLGTMGRRYLLGPDAPHHGNPNPLIVTVHGDAEQDDRVHWEVVAIPSSLVPLPLPTPYAAPVASLHDLEPAPLQRQIRYEWVNSEGDVENEELVDWPSFSYRGRSVLMLRARVARQLHERPGDITLCIWAGLRSRPVPLVSDLPLNGEPMVIVVYTHESQGAAELSYPVLEVLPAAPAPKRLRKPNGRYIGPEWVN